MYVCFHSWKPCWTDVISMNSLDKLFFGTNIFFMIMKYNNFCTQRERACWPGGRQCRAGPGSPSLWRAKRRGTVLWASPGSWGGGPSRGAGGAPVGCYHSFFLIISSMLPLLHSNISINHILTFYLHWLIFERKLE